MAIAAGDKFNPASCQDIIGLQEHLKRLRSVDDSIILNLNTTVLTTSFQKDIEQNIKNCKALHEQLNQAYESRNKIINICLADADAKVAQLIEAKQQNYSDLTVQKELKRQQTKQRMIRKEVTVEEIIQDRSLKALQERCRRYVSF